MPKPHRRYPSATQMSKLARQAAQNDVAAVSTASALPSSGIALIAGGTGLALSVTPLEPGDHLRAIVVTLASGNVVVTAPAGVTFDGTNNTITMNAPADAFEIVYESPTVYRVVTSTSIALSAV